MSRSDTAGGAAMAIDAADAPKQARGRPRKFVDADIRKKMRTCFAFGGYHRTTIDDLSAATGLSKPSLYNAFGDKHSIYLRALDDELSDLKARLSGVERNGTLADRLSDFFRATTIGYRPSSREVPGIAFGAALAGASVDPDVNERLRRFGQTLDDAATLTLAGCGDRSAAILLSAYATGFCVRLKTGSWKLEDVNFAALAAILKQR